MSTNPKITAIAIKAASELAGLIRESEADILAGMHKAAEEAQLQESKPKFKLGFTITLDLDADVAIYNLGWSTKVSRETSSQIPDPDQLALPNMDQTDDVSRFIHNQLLKSDIEDQKRREEE